MMFSQEQVFSDVKRKIKKKNKILFDRKSSCLQDLRELICQQHHLTLVLWSLECVQTPMEKLIEKYPDEADIQLALEQAWLWAHGDVKISSAKRAILDCHAFAKKMTDAADVALCHAVGQGCSTVHIETHALGLVFYELTAIIIECGYKDYEDAVMEKIRYYEERLKYWQENAPEYIYGKKWTEFLTRPGKVNKEKLLLEKESVAEVQSIKT